MNQNTPWTVSLPETLKGNGTTSVHEGMSSGLWTYQGANLDLMLQVTSILGTFRDPLKAPRYALPPLTSLLWLKVLNVFFN